MVDMTINTLDTRLENALHIWAAAAREDLDLAAAAALAPSSPPGPAPRRAVG